MKDLVMHHGWVIIFKKNIIQNTALPLAPPMKEGVVHKTLTPVKSRTPVVLKSRPTTLGTGPQTRAPLPVSVQENNDWEETEDHLKQKRCLSLSTGTPQVCN